MVNIRAQYDRLPSNFRSFFRSLIPDRFLRWYAHEHTDVFLFSYPKCGRTWLRLMIGKAIVILYDLPSSEDNLFIRWKHPPHPQIPRLRVYHDDRPMLKTPEELETSKKKYQDKKVIFLVRDPRDVIVSSYFEIKNRAHLFGQNPYENHQQGYEGSMEEFIHRRTGGFDSIIQYFNIWAENRHIPADFLLVRYEDIKANPAVQLRRTLEFIGIGSIPEVVIDEAIEFASFESMRQMETQGAIQHGMLKPGDKNATESFKTRKGKIRGFVDYLDDDEIEILNQKIQNKLDKYFGYS